MKKERITGIIDINKGGFGFVRQDDGDIFIGKDDLNGAMNGDEVSVDLLPEYLWEKNREGMVDRVISRANREVVGKVYNLKGRYYVIPENPKLTDWINVAKGGLGSAKRGDTVTITITSFPKKNRHAEGNITEVISRRGDKTGGIKALYRSYGIREEFPRKVSAEADFIGSRPITQDDISRRMDLRDKKIFTIDGAYSKDLDDAVSIDIMENGNYSLGVHIADVSEYVRGGSYLDKEALKRGTSVYVLNQVVPMLPKTLSNGICSLNPEEDRLTVSCIMEINEKGEVVDHQIVESVINSKARLVYDDVSDILECEDQDLIEKYSFIYEDLKTMEKLAEILREKRKAEGSIDFDLDEAVITLDENEVPLNVGIANRRTAEKIIEEFMLEANKTVAEHYYWMNYPFIYRVHEKPDTDKIMELKAFLGSLGISLPGNPDNIHPKALNKILESIEGKDYEKIVSTVILRAMKKAFYSPECMGHFGLSFKYYCHFTSPIRRYPDLMIHRIIKTSLRGEGDEKVLQKYRLDVIEASSESSRMERVAQEVEREGDKMKMAEYMENHIGEVYDGIISGVTGFGIFVQLQNTIEGLVPIHTLTDDYYIFEADKYRLIGESTKHIYALGDKVRIKVVKASSRERIIDFALV